MRATEGVCLERVNVRHLDPLGDARSEVGAQRAAQLGHLRRVRMPIDLGDSSRLSAINLGHLRRVRREDGDAPMERAAPSARRSLVAE